MKKLTCLDVTVHKIVNFWSKRKKSFEEGRNFKVYAGEQKLSGYLLEK